jgi:5-formyltetrahydrofolate cyclo-ligase
VTTPSPDPGPSAQHRKTEARRRIRARLRGLPPQAFLDAGIAVARHLRPLFESLARERPGATVGLFASLPREIRTGPISETLQAVGLHRALPTWHTGELVFHRLGPEEAIGDLPPDSLGIHTPTEDHPVVPLAELALILVPGLAFDREGYRLGQGGGFYDRALAPGQGESPQRSSDPLLRTIGIALDPQRVRQVVREAWDQPVDALCTPESGLVLRPRG